MLDINTINQRYFDLLIKKTKYEIEPCSVKTLKRLLSIDKLESDAAFEEYIQLMKKIVDKNKANQPIALATLEELSIDQVNYILAKYMEWMTEIKNSPNL